MYVTDSSHHFKDATRPVKPVWPVKPVKPAKPVKPDL